MALQPKCFLSKSHLYQMHRQYRYVFVFTRRIKVRYRQHSCRNRSHVELLSLACRLYGLLYLFCFSNWVQSKSGLLSISVLRIDLRCGTSSLCIVSCRIFSNSPVPVISQSLTSFMGTEISLLTNILNISSLLLCLMVQFPRQGSSVDRKYGHISSVSFDLPYSRWFSSSHFSLVWRYLDLSQNNSRTYPFDHLPVFSSVNSFTFFSARYMNPLCNFLFVDVAD